MCLGCSVCQGIVCKVTQLVQLGKCSLHFATVMRSMDPYDLMNVTQGLSTEAEILGAFLVMAKTRSQTRIDNLLHDENIIRSQKPGSVCMFVDSSGF